MWNNEIAKVFEDFPTHDGPLLKLFTLIGVGIWMKCAQNSMLRKSSRVISLIQSSDNDKTS